MRERVEVQRVDRRCRAGVGVRVARIAHVHALRHRRRKRALIDEAYIERRLLRALAIFVEGVALRFGRAGVHDRSGDRVAGRQKDAGRVISLIVHSELRPQRARKILVVVDLQVVLVGFTLIALEAVEIDVDGTLAVLAPKEGDVA